MISIFYSCLFLVSIISTTTAHKLHPADIPVSNYEEHGVEGQVLIFDGRTRLFIPPKFPDLPKQEAEKAARDLSIYSEWKHLYCKQNFFESDWPPFTAHFTVPNWCRFTRTDGRWEDLCCGTNHCDCDPVTGLGCKCYPYGKPNQNTLDLEPGLAGLGLGK